MLDPIASRLEHYLDLLSVRQKLVAGNIANADTPGYKTKDLDFRTTLESILDGARPQAVGVEGLQTKTDGNNVSLDRESRLLAENAIRFNLASNLLRAQIRVVRAAIQEGKNG
jgi:flagellar basal-body rod protein FlgB